MKALLRHRLVRVLIYAEVVALFAASFGLTFLLGLRLPVETSIVDVLTAAGTIGATVVAVALAYRGFRRERDEIARVVSAWTLEDYVNNRNRTSMIRRVTVHIANESNEPVFDARINIVAGYPRTFLGPLGVPSEIAVIPPRRQMSFDISIPLLSRDSTSDPRVELYFTDPSGCTWRRGVEGTLSEITAPATFDAVMSEDEEALLNQLEVSNPKNPLFVAFALWRTLSTQPPGLVERSQFNAVLSDASALRLPNANWVELREWADQYVPASGVEYPVRQVAYVKLVPIALEGQVAQGGAKIEIADVKWMTLILTDTGWLIYDVGPYHRPDQIDFNGALWG